MNDIDNMKIIVNKLLELNKTISTMESCTGGGVSNMITNIEGASGVLKFSCTTYSNEYKIKMGVDEDTILKYSVYSKEVAREMAYNISNFSNSNYGIGITGKLMREDIDNIYGDNNKVYICIYDRDNLKYYDYTVFVNKSNRVLNKEVVINKIIDELINILV